ncbi:MAG: ammonium transporter [Myxococcota bacterium]|nr:ammonium transporter [Myxococcota bacterium]
MIRQVNNLITKVSLPLSVLALLLVSTQATAAETTTDMQVAVDTVWVVLAGILVFFMNAGFGLLETGFCRAKNAVSILSKNFTVASCAGLSFFMVGFGIMFGDGNDYFGLSGFFMVGADNSPAMGDAYTGVFSSLNWTGIPLEAKFFFQVCFAMTAASIVSGAVAERVQFSGYILFAIGLTAIIYSVTGHWIWGGGWLANLGFWDFAGSTQVHAVGGWAALMGVIVLGPRRGKYKDGGKIHPIPGHNLAIATAGGFILWVGWFGFNAGSTMAADPGAIAHIAYTTMLASMAGIAGAMVTNYALYKHVDLTMLVNGALAGLVGITAPCAFVSGGSSIIIGLIAGFLVVISVMLFDRAHIDDPVGATSVHLVCGIWGTLALGLFAEARFSADVGNGLFFGGGTELVIAQVIGIVAVGVYAASVSWLLWKILATTLGIRVSPEDEMLGLDISEMGIEAYAPDTVPHRLLSSRVDAKNENPVNQTQVITNSVPS